MKEKLDYFRNKLVEVRKSEMEFKMRAGEFDKEFNSWLAETGLPPKNYHVLDLIEHFSKVQSGMGGVTL